MRASKTTMHPILGALLLLILVKARGMQELYYCHGTVVSTSFNATGAVTVTTATDLNTALVVATSSQPACTSVITIGACHIRAVAVLHNL